MPPRLPLTKHLTLLSALGTLATAHAAPTPHPQAETQALDLARQAIALRSVAGPDNQTPQVAALFRQALVTGGFSPQDITLTPVDNTTTLIARWHGTDPSLKPLVISGHMDVVEARQSDWQRNPFTPVVENGYLYGRGATDMKLDDTLAIAALLELRRTGYRPRRDIILAFSGDEETTMKTGILIANQITNADLVLNVDGADGVLDEKTGQPAYFTWEGAEKTYADYKLTLTNPGGHSSEPRPANAIDDMAKALLNIQHHAFKPELNTLTRSYFLNAAKFEAPSTATAMRAFAANPADKTAIATLTANPAMVGKIGTTCVVTMINGGHALNALPQSVTANINCRIFPGHTRPAILTELRQAAATPTLTIEDVTAGSVSTDASPMRPDFTTAIQTALHSVYPALPVFASMDSGASDSMWYRSHHVPSYGMSPLFIKPSEDFMHGLNERTPISTIRPSLDILLSLIPNLSH